MPTPTTCFPWWHATYAPMAKITVPSGCTVNSSGNAPCSPESMRANAEAQGRAQGWWPDKHMSLEVYTLARYMTSEVGSGSVEERVAVGEAAVNRVKRWKLGSINNLLLFRQPAGHPNRGYYGPIHGVGTGTSTAPYGRWAATSRDPTNVNLLLADLILSGRSGNFNDGADDQVGIEYFESPRAYVQRKANGGSYWIGPLPGVDHWRTFLVKDLGFSPSSPMGALLLQRGLDAVTGAKIRPVWGNLPICAGGPPSDVGGTIAVGLLVALGLVGGFVLGRRVLPTLF